MKTARNKKTPVSKTITKKKSPAVKKPAIKTAKGLVMVITGNGKGKTTAAFGQALRAIGQGYKVFVLQFMKGRKYGEFIAAEKYLPRLTIRMSGLDSFVMRDNPAAIDIELAQKGLDVAQEAINSGKYNMIILDEINVALDYGLVPVDAVLEILKNKPRAVEVVLTGRNAPPEIIEAGDLVSEIKAITHHYSAGVIARRGVEF